MTPDTWRSLGGFFEWQGHAIFHRVAGAGEPLLVIHGFPTGSWDWWKIWDRLAAKHRALTLDMIGFGFSAKPRAFGYSIMAQADLYEALLAREGVDRYRILAHDYGDTVAQELLARKRGKILSVCLLNGGIFPESHRARPAQKLLASPLGSLFARLMSYPRFAANVRQTWGSHPVGDDELRGMWQLLTTNDGPSVMPKLIGYIAERKLHRDRWVGALVEAGVPLRFIDGLADPVSGPQMVARYRALVPNPDVVELPGVGHFPQLEAPDAVADAALAFLGRP